MGAAASSNQLSITDLVNEIATGRTAIDFDRLQKKSPADDEKLQELHKTYLNAKVAYHKTKYQHGASDGFTLLARDIMRDAKSAYEAYLRDLCAAAGGRAGERSVSSIAVQKEQAKDREDKRLALNTQGQMARAAQKAQDDFWDLIVYLYLFKGFLKQATHSLSIACTFSHAAANPNRVYA